MTLRSRTGLRNLTLKSALAVGAPSAAALTSCLMAAALAVAMSELNHNFTFNRTRSPRRAQCASAWWRAG